MNMCNVYCKWEWRSNAPTDRFDFSCEHIFKAARGLSSFFFSEIAPTRIRTVIKLFPFLRNRCSRSRIIDIHLRAE